MSYSSDARRLAVHVYKSSDWSLETAAAHLGVPRSTLQRWVKASAHQPELEDRPRPGRPRKLGHEHLEFLRELTQLHPSWTQHRFAQELNERFEDLGVNQELISRSLKRMGITLKKKVSGPNDATSQESND